MNSEIRGLRLAIAGCGNIAGHYARAIQKHSPLLELRGFFDLDSARATALAGGSGARVYASLDELLADEEVDVVVNLTVHFAHVEVITRCLEAGKHVYTEKPLALDAADAARLVQLAGERNLRLASAPITFLGEAQETARQLVQSGRLGTVRMVYAEMNWNCIERWHPAPQPFFEVGSTFDVGVYPLTVLTETLGPVKSVQGMGKILKPERTTTEGKPFTVGTPDWLCSLLEFESGAYCRLTTSFYTGASQQNGIEFQGDEAILYLGQADNFGAKLAIRPRDGGDWEDVPLPEATQPGIDWARGLVDLAHALHEGRPHRASAARAAHVVEIAQGVHTSIATGQIVAINSRF